MRAWLGACLVLAVGCGPASRNFGPTLSDVDGDGDCVTTDPLILSLTEGVTVGTMTIDNGCFHNVPLLDVHLDDPDGAFAVVDPEGVGVVLLPDDVLQVEIELVADDGAQHEAQAVVRQDVEGEGLALSTVQLVGGP